MADRVFCIDFGTAYTKVALRRDPVSKAALLACAGADFDYWVPTVVAMDQRSGKTHLEYADRAVDLKSGGGIHVFTNFKKDLFLGSDGSAPKPAVPALDALFQSDEFAALAAKYNVLPGQLAALRAMSEAARALHPQLNSRGAVGEVDRQTNAARLAYHFFAWLRKSVLQACEGLNGQGLDFASFPTRVTVPALSDGDPAQHPGCKLLHKALTDAKWPLHTERPFVTEPESNAIGVLTQATNIVTPIRHEMNLGEMLKKGPLNTVVAGHTQYTSYRALVIDVGAFTTDLASLSLDTGGKQFTFSATERFRVKQTSVPFGVTDFDARVVEALPPAKREWLSKEPRKSFLAFQKMAYAPDGRGLRVPGVGTVGGADDRPAVQACLNDFAARLGAEVTAFCAGTERGKMQELILTGGGSNIPAVRDALIAIAEAQGGPFKKVHAAELTSTATDAPLVDPLDPEFARGAGALGGASLYFDKSYR